MATSTHGPGRSLPGAGVDRQTTVVDTTTTNAGAQDLKWADNGARKLAAVQTAAYSPVFGEVVRGDTTSAGFSVTLPTLTSADTDRAPIVVKRTAGSNNITVVGTIDGGTNATVSTTSKVFYAAGSEGWVTQ